MEIIKKYPKTVIIGVALMAFSLGFGAHSFFLDRILISHITRFVENGAKIKGLWTTDKKEGVVPSSYEPTLPDGEDIPATAGVSTLATGTNILVVGNQPAGTSVLMSMVALETQGWVAIHEDRGDGYPGAVLGAQRFMVGRHFTKRIELLRATESGKEYFAVLHADDGDSAFNYDVEKPLMDERGSLVAGAFFATEPE